MEKTVDRCEVSGTVEPPCSKSYAQRAMAAALLCEGETTLRNIEFCDDTRYALEVIRNLGAEAVPLDGHTLSIMGGLDPKTDIINTGESGLAARLFTPIAALSDHRITIMGERTMLRRPVGMMLNPLSELGVKVESDGHLPITVQGPLKGGETTVDGSVSSQFTTGLLMSLPLAQKDTILYVDRVYSIPYLSMTVDMAGRFGIRIEHNDHAEYFIEGGQKYKPADISIEGDWGSAAFMLVAGAIAGKVTVLNMNPVSLQADIAIIEALSRAGASVTITHNDITVARNTLEAFEFDATHSPDLFPILSVLATNCEGVSVIKGAKRLTHKESNRAEAILKEFGRIGMEVGIENEDYLTVKGRQLKGGVMDSCNDHRIAMAGAVAGLAASSPVTVRNAEAVNKSYPRFWDDLGSICGKTI